MLMKNPAVSSRFYANMLTNVCDQTESIICIMTVILRRGQTNDLMSDNRTETDVDQRKIGRRTEGQTKR